MRSIPTRRAETSGKREWARGPLGGIEWGSTADQDRVYVANSDVRFLRDGTRRLDSNAGGDLFALNLSDGKIIVQVAPVPCGERDR